MFMITNYKMLKKGNLREAQKKDNKHSQRAEGRDT